MAESYNYSPVGAEYWLLAEPLLTEALKRGANLYTPDDVYQKLRSGECQLWMSPSHQSAIVTTWTDSAVGQIINLWLGGGNLKEVKDLVVGIEQWGKKHGAVRSMIVGRRGWGRSLPGYTESATLFLKEI